METVAEVHLVVQMITIVKRECLVLMETPKSILHISGVIFMETIETNCQMNKSLAQWVCIWDN